MSVAAQMVVVLKAFVEGCVSLFSVIPSNFPGSRYPKQMYFIVLLLFLPGGSQRSFPLARSSHGQDGAYSEVAAGETISLLASGPG
jgi:hypothetical protein